MADLERTIHDEGFPYPDLVRVALVHVQSETIHPFLDGNGRLGRRLITLVLHQDRVLQYPLLYLSLYLRRHRQEYYRRLDAVRSDGDWEAWLDFFLEGVEQTAVEAVATAHEIDTRIRSDRERVRTSARSTAATADMEALCRRPMLTIGQAQRMTVLPYPGVTKAMDRLTGLGIAREITGRRRNRVSSYDGYLSVILGDASPVEGEP